MGTIFFHADDFGVTVKQSKKILECYEKGLLNSVSLIVNSPESIESYDLIKKYVESEKIRLVAHLNFVEGHCMAPISTVSHLVNSIGMFTCSYTNMLKYNYSNLHNTIKNEFKAEIGAQLAVVAQLTNSKILNIDSHQHYLQIPMIWEAMCEVIEENNYSLNYVRLPVDPISPLIKTPSLFFKVPPINYIKWSLLRFLKPKKKRIPQNAKVPVFFGMPFTCEMTLDKVEKLLPLYNSIAQRKNTDLELMFHPGAVREIDNLLDASQIDLVEFYSSQNRDLEYQTLTSLNI